jgi:hypothetical protein
MRITAIFSGPGKDMCEAGVGRLIETCAGTDTMLCAGLELNVQSYPGARKKANIIETARGAAVSLLSRGAVVQIGPLP